MISSNPYTESDLPIQDGVAYHLGIRAEDLADSILIVGDPDRVDAIAGDFMERIEVRISHRGLTTITGIASDTQQRITITTSGMGAPSAEIVLNELVALSEVDTRTRIRKVGQASLTIIRLGTSGALQHATVLGTSIITSQAVGFDSSAWFYAEGLTHDPTSRELAHALQVRVESSIPRGHPAFGKIMPYGASATPAVTQALKMAADSLGVAYEVGATVTASGFFAPQGRDVGRIRPSVPDLDRLAAADPRFLNMDMETSFVLHFCGGHGFQVGAICVAAANRALNTFAADIAEHMRGAARVAIHALHALKSHRQV